VSFLYLLLLFSPEFSVFSEEVLCEMFFNVAYNVNVGITFGSKPPPLLQPPPPQLLYFANALETLFKTTPKV